MARVSRIGALACVAGTSLGFTHGAHAQIDLQRLDPPPVTGFTQSSIGRIGSDGHVLVWSYNPTTQSSLPWAVSSSGEFRAINVPPDQAIVTSAPDARLVLLSKVSSSPGSTQSLSVLRYETNEIVAVTDSPPFGEADISSDGSLLVETIRDDVTRGFYHLRAWTNGRFTAPPTQANSLQTANVLFEGMGPHAAGDGKSVLLRYTFDTSTRAAISGGSYTGLWNTQVPGDFRWLPFHYSYYTGPGGSWVAGYAPARIAPDASAVDGAATPSLYFLDGTTRSTMPTFPGAVSTVTAISDRGEIVVGRYSLNNGPSMPFIWTIDGGWNELQPWLTRLGAPDRRIKITQVTTMSRDGRWIAGLADDLDHAGNTVVWRAHLPPFCLANCDGSSKAPVLAASDFVCFLNRFRADSLLPANEQTHALANCDGSTTPPVLSASDFVCFLQKFRAGCPN